MKPATSPLGVYSGGGPLVLKLDGDGNVLWATTWEHQPLLGTLNPSPR